MTHLISDDPSEAITVPLCLCAVESTNAMMWRDLFEDVMQKDVQLSHVNLPRHPTKSIDSNKLKSLKKKYHYIPEEYKG